MGQRWPALQPALQLSQPVPVELPLPLSLRGADKTVDLSLQARQVPAALGLKASFLGIPHPLGVQAHVHPVQIQGRQLPVAALLPDFSTQTRCVRRRAVFALTWGVGPQLGLKHHFAMACLGHGQLTTERRTPQVGPPLAWLQVADPPLAFAMIGSPLSLALQPTARPLGLELMDLPRLSLVEQLGLQPLQRDAALIPAAGQTIVELCLQAPAGRVRGHLDLAVELRVWRRRPEQGQIHVLHPRLQRNQ